MSLRRSAAGLVAVALLCGACGSDPGDEGRVDWYVQDPALDAQVLADACDLDVDVVVHQLPLEQTEAHTELVRRLAADGESVDLMAIDAAWVPELAEGGFLRTEQTDAELLPAAVEQVTHDGALHAMPWLLDPMLLWYRGFSAERAGLDVDEPVAWDDLLTGAERIGATVQVADAVGAGTAEWIAGLVAAGGGDVLDGTGTGPAAVLVQRYREARLGPGPSPTAVEDFFAAGGGFLLAPGSAWADPAMARFGRDVETIAYPRVGDEASVPTAGLALARGADGADDVNARRLVECLTAADTVTSLVATTGRTPAQVGLLDDEQALAELPTVDVLKASVSSASTVPVTPDWQLVRRAIDETWFPLASVSAVATPGEFQRTVRAARRGELS